MTEAEQIQQCLNCKRPLGRCDGNCVGLTKSTNHKRTAEEIQELIRQYYPLCETWVDLAERTQVDKTTLKRHCKKLGLKPLVSLRRGNPNYGKRTYRT